MINYCYFLNQLLVVNKAVKHMTSCVYPFLGAETYNVDLYTSNIL